MILFFYSFSYLDLYDNFSYLIFLEKIVIILFSFFSKIQFSLLIDYLSKKNRIHRGKD